jgi:hypothetical protein
MIDNCFKKAIIRKTKHPTFPGVFESWSRGGLENVISDSDFESAALPIHHLGKSDFKNPKLALKVWGFFILGINT